MNHNDRSDEPVSDKFLPGMACRDPETGKRLRMHDGGWCDADGIYADPDEEAWAFRARENGPDLTDLATAAVYAAQRGWQSYPHDGGWVVHPRPLFQDQHCGATLPEAVQAAAKAEGGER